MPESSLSRRALMMQGGLGLIGATLASRPAEAASILGSVQRELMMEMAKSYELQDDARAFKDLNEIMSAFRGLGAWPSTHTVVADATSALSRVLDGESLDRDGFRSVDRRAAERVVVFSDHHIMPDHNRQSGVWRANRDGYTKVLRHYGEEGWVVAENGDVEDLVILEPEETVATYRELLVDRSGRKRIRGRGRRALQDWFREDPEDLLDRLDAARLPRRQKQFDAILGSPGNAAYYEVLAKLAESDQLVRVAGNHDYNLQSLDARAPHLVPVDILLATGERTVAVMHGHQFDEATNPGVARLYGEVISECAGVWYQGPDRLWDADQVQRILSGGFPNRLATHEGGKAGAGAFASAILTSSRASDEEWAHAWEGVFGHPIAWEYGASDWAASVRGAFAKPGRLIDDAMVGKQFFKFRHLDEVAIVDSMLRWGIEASLVLGHSHEVRDIHAGPIGRYYNSGAAGRFVKLLWALEMEGDRVEVVAWHIEPDGRVQRYVFERKDAALFSYFDVKKAKESVR